MNNVAWFIPLALCLMFSAWAAVLGLSEEAPGMVRDGRERPAGPSFRAFFTARVCVLFLAGGTAGMTVGWWQHLPGPAVLSLTVSAGFLYMVTEALPKSVGALAPDLSVVVSGLAARLLVPFRPILSLVDAFERRAARILPPEGEPAGPSRLAQRHLLLGVFSLEETTVGEIMTPRLDIAAIDGTADWANVVDFVSRSEHARIPVFLDTLDNIQGVLFAKDLVGIISGISPVPDRWQTLVRPAQFVPESKTLATQLHDFQRSPSHLAIVVDEYGGTSGLVTLEDVLEEVVGEIRDEYDLDETPAVEREGEDKWWVDGSVTVDELSALLGVPISDEEVSTVGGWVYQELGQVPRPGEEFRFGQYRVVVERVERRRVHRVYFERTHGEVGGGEETSAP